MTERLVKLKEPSTFDLMGGSEWNNNGKNIIVVHKQEREGIEYEIHIKENQATNRRNDWNGNNEL